MRRIPRYAVGLLLIAATVVPVRPAAADVVNRVVLRVNDRVATFYDYAARRNELLQQISQQKMDTDQQRRLYEQAGEQVFRNMFEELLLLSRADQLKIKVSDSELDSALADIRKNMGIDSEEDFQKAVEQSGIPYPRFRERWRQNLLLQDVLNREVRSKIELSDEDLRRIYRSDSDRFKVPERLHLKEVVILDDSDLSPEERQQLAASIHQELVDGRTLEQVVAESSKKGEVSDVIDLGWVKPGELSADLEKGVWELPAGSFSDPIPGRGGIHELEVVERQEASVKPFEDVAGEIRAKEQARLFQEKITDYLAKLEKDSYIVINAPPEAQGFRSLGTTVPDEIVGGSEEGDEGAEAPPAEGEQPAVAAPEKPDEAPPPQTLPPPEAETGDPQEISPPS